MPDFSSLDLAAKALNDLTAQEAAEKARIDAAVAAALGAINAPVKVVYLDAVAGLDTNDGSTPARAVATPQAAAALIGAGQRGAIVLCSDVTVAQPLSLAGDFLFYSYGNAEYQAGGVSGVGTGGITRTLKIAPSALAPAAPGTISAAIFTAIGSYLYLMGVNLAVGALAGGSGAIQVNGAFVMGRGALTLDPNCSVPLLFSSTRYNAYFTSSTVLPASYGGRLFSGVAAGANPNGFLISSNLTAG